MGTHAEVLDSLTGVPLSTEEDGVGASRGAQRELVEGEHLAAGVEDALLGRAGEAEGGNRELREGLQADVVGYGTNNDDSLGLDAFGATSLLGDLGERDGRAVDFRLEESLEDHLKTKCKCESAYPSTPIIISRI